MLWNYLLISYRTIKRFWGYSLLNVFGLGLGIASCLIINSYVLEDLKWDSFIEDQDHIFRINQILAFPDTEVQHISNTCPMFAPAMMDNLPEVEMFARIFDSNINQLQEGDDSRFFWDTYFADSTFFQVFSYPIDCDDRSAILTDPNSVVLRADIAESLFPDGNAIGQTLLLINGNEPYNENDLQEHPLRTVTGVYDIPEPGSFFQPSMIFPAHSANANLQTWNDHFLTTFLRLTPGADPNAVIEQAMQLMNDREDQEYVTLYLQPFSELHMHSGHVTNQVNWRQSSATYVYSFSVVAVFILLIASVNYINLASARSISRAKEVGLRKVVGAQRSNLIFQFLGESTAITALAMVFAVLLVELVKAPISNLVGRPITFSLNNLEIILALSALTVIIGTASGIYPALVLSSFRPSKVLKGEAIGTPGKNYLRKSLVIFQFVATIFLIIAITVIFNQLHYMRTKDLGYTTDNIISINASTPEGAQRAQTFAQSISDLHGIERVSISGGIPGLGNWESNVTVDGSDVTYISHFLDLDGSGMELFDLELLEGRFIDEANHPADAFRNNNEPVSVVVNQKLADMVGWEDPVGQTLYFWGRANTVVGLIENFHHRSLHSDYHPMVLFRIENRNQYINVSLSPDMIDETMEEMERLWSEIVPEQPFQYFFVADNFSRTYHNELQAEKVLGVFTILAIIIGCLGMLGLTAYSTERRTKEIGIRKVLGANSLQMLSLLNREFSVLVLLSNLLAWPLAWLIMKQWLDNFHFHISINWWIFPLAGVFTILLAVGTVSMQVWRTTQANPTDMIRYE